MLTKSKRYWKTPDKKIAITPLPRSMVLTVLAKAFYAFLSAVIEGLSSD